MDHFFSDTPLEVLKNLRERLCQQRKSNALIELIDKELARRAEQAE